MRRSSKARYRRLGRDAFAEVAHTGRTDDHVAALGEWQRQLDQAYRQ
jgi:hypothetical protein